MEKSATLKLSGWGRYPVEESIVYRPERRAAIAEILGVGPESDYIARGLGRSYGDTALNKHGGVIDLSRLNRMIAFDAEEGVLECEAGTSLAEIIDTFLPRGYFLPVTPGTKFVTVGGAIANDVHGKNHHRDGAFGNFVVDFTLLTASGEVLPCSPTQNADVFHATIGGIGLTGLILTARIRLRRVETAYIRVDYRRAPNIEAALAAMAESDAQYQYSVAWIDCLAKGAHLGRSVLMWGNHARLTGLAGAPALAASPLRPKQVHPKSVPVDFPGFVLNPWSIRAFNTVFYAVHRDTVGALVDYDRYFYPLDRIHHWNRMYGRAGFCQFQATLPKSSVATLVELLERLSRSSCASFLAVLKCFGDEGPGYLSHPMPGYTLAFDIPNRHELIGFLDELHVLVLNGGGRIYLGKDAAAKANMIPEMYPRLDGFREVCRRLDPYGRLSSSMARRLALVHD
ncbi:MAG TPA: FAD-binding oxidoreductase [Candidatus Hydrogenedentes bacterium]|nr:FAD-binding oxidoreductase [Candidatus Hydrogenedentota bacterium]HPG67446.1 FAD-binding oxidoreductase [Candidatus Hydrogenedentota bacterium]